MMAQASSCCATPASRQWHTRAGWVHAKLLPLNVSVPARPVSHNAPSQASGKCFVKMSARVSRRAPSQRHRRRAHHALASPQPLSRQGMPGMWFPGVVLPSMLLPGMLLRARPLCVVEHVKHSERRRDSKRHTESPRCPWQHTDIADAKAYG